MTFIPVHRGRGMTRADAIASSHVMRKIHLLLIPILLFNFFAPPLTYSILHLEPVPVAAAADEDDDETSYSSDRVLEGLGLAAEQAGFEEEKTVEQITAGVINAILGVLGVAFVLILVYAGILYLTAYGEEEKVKKDKETDSNRHHWNDHHYCRIRDRKLRLRTSCNSHNIKLLNSAQ